jgi:putative RNA 2'-phosphotransferase
MDPKKIIKISKYLSKHLRHEPERLGLTLAPGGWVEVQDLLAACARNHFPISPEVLQQVVKENDKQRFSFDDTGTRIRANQGHSADVDLQLEPLEPPPILYHGTAAKNTEIILQNGLQKMARHHVHLSADQATALKVGQRHGKPVIFEVNTAAMHQHGILFFRSSNGVWLVDEVPPNFLRLLLPG